MNIVHGNIKTQPSNGLIQGSQTIPADWLIRLSHGQTYFLTDSAYYVSSPPVHVSTCSTSGQDGPVERKQNPQNRMQWSVGEDTVVFERISVPWGSEFDRERVWIVSRQVLSGSPASSLAAQHVVELPHTALVHVLIAFLVLLLHIQCFK